MVNKTEGETLIPKQEIDDINEPQYGHSENFEKVTIRERSMSAGYDMRSYWNVAICHDSNRVLTTAPSVYNDEESASLRVQSDIEQDLFPQVAGEMEPAGFAIKKQQEALKQKDILIETLDSIDDASKSELSKQMRAIQAVARARFNGQADKIAGKLDDSVRGLHDVSLWLTAYSKVEATTIAARVIGFRHVHTLDGLPLIEPIVLSQYHKQPMLLPVGYELNDEFMYLVLDIDDEEI